MNLLLETGESVPAARCACCGRESQTVHGFVYRDGDAYGIYYAGWSEGHPERGVTLAVAVGEWGDGSDATDRVSIGLQVRATASQVQISVIAPGASPWAQTELLGAMLPRDAALAHPALDEIFETAEHVVATDERIAAILAAQGA